MPGSSAGRLLRPADFWKKGFTLLELIVVMFLIVLIMGISAAFFANTLPGSAFNATVRDVSSAMRLTRSLAQMRGASQAMTIDLDRRTYRAADRPEKIFPAAVQVKVIDPVAGDITTGSYEITFPAIGGAEGGSIVLWNKARTVQIWADAVAGSVAAKSQ